VIAATAATTLRLALSKSEAAEAIDVSVDLL
jgi:hypothetical protein